MFRKWVYYSQIKNICNVNPIAVSKISNRRFYIELLKKFYCHDEFEKKVIEDIFSRKTPMQWDITRIRNYMAKQWIILKEKNLVKEKELREEYSPINNLISSMKRWFHF